MRIKILEAQVSSERCLNEDGFFDIEEGEIHCQNGVIVLKQIHIENQKKFELKAAITFLKNL